MCAFLPWNQIYGGTAAYVRYRYTCHLGVDVNTNLTVRRLQSSSLLDNPQHLVNMLSHLNNDHHNNRVRRSKSATSVKERRKHPIAIEPIGAESARMQALIAAHRAMDRSRGSSEADMYRSDSSASKQSARLARGRYAANQSNPAAQLQRQRSLLQATSPNLAVTLPLPSGGSATRSGPHSTTYTTELPEFGDNFEGEPSSYRRLRKTHSVLNPSHG